MAKLFTDTEVKKLKAKDRQFEIFESPGLGKGSGCLGVRVQPGGKKMFVFRYFFESKRRFITLGSCQSLTLAQARTQAREYGELVQSGLDPKQQIAQDQKRLDDAARAEAMKGSIQQLFKAYTDNMRDSGKRTYDRVLHSLETDVYPVIAPDTKAKDVNPSDIRLVLARMIQRDAVVQSNRVRSYLSAAFNYGLGHDNDPAKMSQEVLFGIIQNPVVAIPKQSAAEKPGTNYLKINELCSLLEKFEETPKIGWQTANLLKLIVHLGGQRPFEIVTAEWKNVDIDKKTLLVDSDRSKNSKPHLIPLTDSALKILEQQKQFSRDSKFIFARLGDHEQHVRPDSLPRAAAYFRKHNPDFPHWIPRDMRRTCKTLMGELGLSKEIRDRVQNHAFQDVSAKHYDKFSYLPQKREALESWEKCLLAGGFVKAENVIALKAV